MISRMTGIQYGTTMNKRESDFESLKTIQSDGQVDQPFLKSNDSFISSITDERVQAFLQTDKAPDDSWVAHELGGYDSDNQSLFIEDGQVVLRSQIEENGKSVRHLIEAPYDEKTGKVDLETSSEGYDIESTKKTLTFTIPGAKNVVLHDSLDSFLQAGK